MAYEDKLIEYHNKALDTEAVGNYLDPVITYQDQIPFEHHQGYVPDLATGLMSYGLNKFPELRTEGHYDFNDFIAQNPDILGTDYNVVGGMNIGDVIKPGKKKVGYDWSGNKSLSTLGGIYGLWDSYISGEDQNYKEGLADAYRNIKGIGIQRDWNPLGLLYNEDEADYYKGLYKKVFSDFQKKKQFEEAKMLADMSGGTFDRPGPGPKPGGGDGGWSPSGADLSPGGGYGQSPTGSDIAGTPFSRGGILGAF